MNSTAHPRLLTGLLSTSRIRLNVSAPSKKRMFEELAGLLSHNRSDLHRDTVFQVLNERERLGSTGIGGGIALPHGRLNGLTEPLAAVIRLRQALDFDSIKTPILKNILNKKYRKPQPSFEAWISAPRQFNASQQKSFCDSKNLWLEERVD